MNVDDLREVEHQVEQVEHQVDFDAQSQPAPIENPDEDEPLCRPLLILDI